MAYTLSSLHSDAAAQDGAADATDTAFAPHSSVRSYSGEHQAHAHAMRRSSMPCRAAWSWRWGGRSAFVDAVSGMLIPAGVDHGYLAAPRSRVFVIDAPSGPGLDRMRRFSVPPALRGRESEGPATEQLAQVLQAPGLLARRGLDLQGLAAQVHSEIARFHARFVSWRASRPRPGCAACAWMRPSAGWRGACLWRHGAALRLCLGQCAGLCAAARPGRDGAAAARLARPHSSGLRAFLDKCPARRRNMAAMARNSSASSSAVGIAFVSVAACSGARRARRKAWARAGSRPSGWARAAGRLQPVSGGRCWRFHWSCAGGRAGRGAVQPLLPNPVHLGLRRSGSCWHPWESAATASSSTRA